MHGWRLLRYYFVSDPCLVWPVVRLQAPPSVEPPTNVKCLIVILNPPERETESIRGYGS